MKVPLVYLHISPKSVFSIAAQCLSEASVYNIKLLFSFGNLSLGKFEHMSFNL